MKKINVKNLASSLFVLFTLLLVIFVVENSFIIPSLVVKSFELVYFVNFGVFAISLMTFYILYSLQGNNFKSIYFIGGIISIILIINMIVALVLPNPFRYIFKNENGELIDVSIAITGDYRLRSVLLTVLTFVFLLMFVVVYPQKKSARNTFIGIAILYVIVSYFLIGYSLIKEFPLYKKIITHGISISGDSPSSLFVNRNLFASYLFGGILFCFYLVSIMKKHRYIPILLTLPIAGIIFFTYSKTKILLTAFVFTAYFITILVIHYKKHPVFMTTLLLTFIGLVTTIVLLRVMPAHSETNFGILLRKILPDKLFSGESLGSRINYWRVGFVALKSSWQTLVFGEGFYLSRMILGESLAYLGYYVPSLPYGNFHNGYLEIWANIGIIGLVSYLAFLIYMIYIYIRIYKHNKLFSIYSFIALATLLINSSVESITPFLFNSEGIIHALPVFMPQLIYFYQIKKVKLIHNEEITNELVIK